MTFGRCLRETVVMLLLRSEFEVTSVRFGNDTTSMAIKMTRRFTFMHNGCNICQTKWHYPLLDFYDLHYFLGLKGK